MRACVKISASVWDILGDGLSLAARERLAGIRFLLGEEPLLLWEYLEKTF